MDRLTRRIAAAALVLAASAGSFFVARGRVKPYSPAAPDYRTLGPAGAKVTIVEFSDFECPACRVAEPPMRGLLKLYDGKVRLVFKHFPLERMHKFARPAAIASECAGRQGKFWEFHHDLYDRQSEWPAEKFEERMAAYAKNAKLDLAAWSACRRDPSVDAAVSADAKDGDNAWVGSTPTFFINGKRFVGARQLAEMGTPWVEKELKK
ncbi:MAG: thioredoxin domain-containing protein [Elusimicrobia bacterium]|nr:thioredoxin domain-containing protein [Elusimicrobiota bacterium]